MTTATATMPHMAAHRARAPFGTGLHTAQLIINGRRSLTAEPLLLDQPGRLHRVDTSQMPAHADGGAAGACRLPTAEQGFTHDCGQGHRCTCRPAPAAPHTEPEVPDSERDGRAFVRVWLGYLGVLALAVVSATWLSTH